MEETPAMDERVAIRCGISQKRLADIDIQSLYFYCKECHAPHHIGKEELLRIWAQLSTKIPQDGNIYVHVQQQVCKAG